MSYNQAKADEYQAQFIYLSATGETDEFSWKPCPCCGSKLGGSRHEFTGRLKTGETDTDWVCEDCAIYIVNGELPFEDDQGLPSELMLS